MGDDIELGAKLSEKELCPEELLKGQEAAFARDIERLQQRRHEFVSVACPACHSEKWREAFTKFGFSYVRCAKCATLFMNPRPAPPVMRDYYQNSENYRYWAKYIFPASEQSRREKIHRPWLKRIRDYCQRYGIDAEFIVEVGPGFGTFGLLVKESGAFNRYLAIEPTPELAQACRKRGLEVIAQPVEEVKDELGANVVAAFEVIEHLFAPEQFLRHCGKILAADGLLVISCPNGQGFDIEVLGAKSLAIDAEHVNLFNPASLRQLVESCGFAVKEVTTPGRLDAEFVREAILRGELDVANQPFLKRVLIDEWDRLGWPFQNFLAEHGLSAHMWLAAVKKDEAIKP